MNINVVTIFPGFFEVPLVTSKVPLVTSILGRAAAAGLVKYGVVDLRDFTHDRHRTVDDVPYGGISATSRTTGTARWTTNRTAAGRAWS